MNKMLQAGCSVTGLRHRTGEQRPEMDLLCSSLLFILPLPRSAEAQQRKSSSTCFIHRPRTSLKLIPPPAVFISALYFCLKPVVDNSWTCQTITTNNCLRSWNFLQMLVPAWNPPPPPPPLLFLAPESLSDEFLIFFPPHRLTLSKKILSVIQSDGCERKNKKE